MQEAKEARGIRIESIVDAGLYQGDPYVSFMARGARYVLTFDHAITPALLAMIATAGAHAGRAGNSSGLSFSIKADGITAQGVESDIDTIALCIALRTGSEMSFSINRETAAALIESIGAVLADGEPHTTN